jgi:hypothetical protein
MSRKHNRFGIQVWGSASAHTANDDAQFPFNVGALVRKYDVHRAPTAAISRMAIAIIAHRGLYRRAGILGRDGFGEPRRRSHYDCDDYKCDPNDSFHTGAPILQNITTDLGVRWKKLVSPQKHRGHRERNIWVQIPSIAKPISQVKT